METISLRVSVPVCAFRKPYAREYLETETVPPPATVYGFLLSLAGEADRRAYLGTRLAIAVVDRPDVSTVLRTSWRVKNKKAAPGTGNNRTPDYQEILTGLRFGVWVAEGLLADRLSKAAKGWGAVARFGGLSLGESRDLVDQVHVNPNWSAQRGWWLTPEAAGDLPLPVWVDHVGAAGTRWVQFSLKQGELSNPENETDARWIRIHDGSADR